jgi:hypothetical protein
MRTVPPSPKVPSAARALDFAGHQTSSMISQSQPLSRAASAVGTNAPHSSILSGSRPQPSPQIRPVHMKRMCASAVSLRAYSIRLSLTATGYTPRIEVMSYCLRFFDRLTVALGNLHSLRARLKRGTPLFLYLPLRPHPNRSSTSLNPSHSHNPPSHCHHDRCNISLLSNRLRARTRLSGSSTPRVLDRVQVSPSACLNRITSYLHLQCF